MNLRRSLLLSSLGLLLAPIPRLQRYHSRLADLSIPTVKAVQFMGLDDGTQFNLVAFCPSRLAV